jgi:hypothetical protein
VSQEDQDWIELLLLVLLQVLRQHSGDVLE